ncbi:MAG: phosphotransferase [Nitrospiraceae bacterium]|nr:phosphotransferase [Nitrospiraceae bacterium]
MNRVVLSRLSAIPVSADGSDRHFFKIHWRGKTALAIEPSPGDIGICEAKSYVAIGKYLASVQIPVPKIYAFDRKTGLIVLEYLGDRCLQKEVLALISKGDWHGVRALYRKAISILAEMQVIGSHGFDVTWCCDSQYYDSKLAMEREASYFLSFFVEGLMGHAKTSGVEDELRKLTLQVDSINNRRFFLHRDFQSRNILVQDGILRVIDFQGGRLGPLGYDLAALILDPYVALPRTIYSEFLSIYLEKLAALGIVMGRDSFEKEFFLLALLRTMQTLGAYSYLYLVKKKAFFVPYISPALSTLKALLNNKAFEWMDQVRSLVADLIYHSPTPD